MLERLATWWKVQTDIQTLQGLDDRMLEDMGFERGEIRRRVLGPPEEAPPRWPAGRAGRVGDGC